jgi:plasmid stabilization system protein ParE
MRINDQIESIYNDANRDSLSRCESLIGLIHETPGLDRQDQIQCIDKIAHKVSLLAENLQIGHPLPQNSYANSPRMRIYTSLINACSSKGILIPAIFKKAQALRD